MELMLDELVKEIMDEHGYDDEVKTRVFISSLIGMGHIKQQGNLYSFKPKSLHKWIRRYEKLARMVSKFQKD